ncbi:MAG TPA: GNAT family N-acetyltransferase [Gaiellaceae bacterium]
MNELERVEAQALRDAVALGGGRAETAGGAMCLSHPAPLHELNRAIPVGAHVDAAAILDWYGGRPHDVCVPPGYLGLDESLRALGYEPAQAWTKFRRGDDPARPAPTAFRVEETLDAAVFAVAAAQPEELVAFVGAPGWACFVAWDDDEPAGCGALYADGEVAWLGVGATRPEYRGRGAQSALLAARIEAGRAVGVRRFSCETGEEGGPSYRNLLRAGFHEAYVRPNWRSAA